MASPPPLPPSALSAARPPVAPPVTLVGDGNLAQHVSPISLVSSPTQMEDFFGFCKRVNPRQFEQIIKGGQLMQCGPDSIIYLQGETSDSFYVINGGMVEVVVSDVEGQNPIPITYLSRGDLFGEIGLLTDVPRTASVRVPEAATLLRFDQETFQRLISTMPAFGQYLAMLLARRLHKTTAQLHFYSQARELSGSLDFFDLPTIFQTISLSQQHGIMNIFNLTSEVLGEFAFASGTPISARFQNLYGMEALYQLFQVTPKANFGFTRLSEPPVVDSTLPIPNVNEFTINAIHYKDEMRVLEEKLKLSEEQPFKRVHARLDWKDPELEACAKELWQAIMKEPLPFNDLSMKLPFCRYNILRVLDRLFETGQLAYAETTPYGYR